MTALELANQIMEMIAEGSLSPDAVVVRPFCMCDEDGGWVEARYVDRVNREKAPFASGPVRDQFPGTTPMRYASGMARPGTDAHETVKLG